jgi:biotin transport system substrate-specific component
MHARAATVYDLIRPSSRWLEIPLLLGFNLLLVACAQIAIDLPYVPITGQTFGVILIAMALGRVRGTGVVLAYLLEGAAGLPVFASGRAGMPVLFGPTGGYLVGFAVAACAVGWFADRGWGRGYVRSIFAMTVGTTIIFLCGVAWLSRFVPADQIWALGVGPFLPGAAVKIGLAAAMLPSVFRFVRPAK